MIQQNVSGVVNLATPLSIAALDNPLTPTTTVLQREHRDHHTLR
jgi:hypothetical protein